MKIRDASRLSFIGSTAPPISQSQKGIENWGQTHSIYNYLEECDTACIAHEGGVSADFEAMPESDQGWGLPSKNMQGYWWRGCHVGENHPVVVWTVLGAACFGRGGSIHIWIRSSVVLKSHRCEPR